jgi:hypothetical protein
MNVMSDTNSLTDRWGFILTPEQLQQFESLQNSDDYAVKYELYTLHKRSKVRSQANRSEKATQRNRRLLYMNQNPSLFDEESIKERNPELYELYIGM